MRVLRDSDHLRELSRDAGQLVLTPAIAYVAEEERDVTLGLRESMAKGLGVTPRGGGTSIPSQSVGRGAIMLQDRSGVEVRPDGTVVCHPGVVKADLNRVLGPERWVPVDPSSYASCTVGGMVANNASGVRTPKYGSTIDYVKGLRAVVPGEEVKAIAPMKVEEALAGEGRIRRTASLIVENEKAISEERPKVTKNSSGYRLERAVHDGMFDLPKLLAGSEGTLAIFTEVALLTRAKPRWKALFIAEASLEELDGTVSAFRELRPTALELVDKSVFRMMNRWERISRFSRSESQYMLFCEFDGDSGGAAEKAEEVALSRAASFDPLVLQSPADISQAWDARNETLTLAQDIKKGARILVPGIEDLVVPPERLGDLVRLLLDQFERRGLDYVYYGHAGDANLHARPFLDPSDRKDMATLHELMEESFEAVWKMGGSMTGEHGDGMLRAEYVGKQYPKTYWIMRELKELFDPKGVLNPGVKLP
ncbi:MAG: FAD-binding oxidoreductase [Nitrososphaerota archaeon]|nr:FAD-binding oxidoreductase [Nitrososphaerota archaeon]